MRSIDPAVDDFAKIEVRLIPGKISMISLDQPSPLGGESIDLILLLA
jgi:hypothetical protein